LNFLVRILFSGLIALVPNEDRTQLDVLLLNVDHVHQLADGTPLPPHVSVVLANAGNCTGDCPTQDLEIARPIFSDKSDAVALDSLAYAVSGGAAWKLAGSSLALQKGSPTAADLPPLVLTSGTRGSANGQLLPIPTTSAARADLSWVANPKLITSGGFTFDPALFGANPPAGLIAGRFRLRSGKVFTYSIARIGTNVTPVHFKRADGQGTVSPYSQAVAAWVAADIEVNGSDIQLIEEKFDGSTGRSMTLSPDANGKIEIAMLNLPPYTPPSTTTNTPGAGKHFEVYYDLAQTTVASENRLVPFTGAAPGASSYPTVAWSSIHPQEQLYSELLNRLRMNAGRTIDEKIICPPGGTLP
jgi:hypothetical protein